REKPNIPETTKRGRRTLKGWVNDVILEGHEKGIDVEKTLEENAVASLDKLEPIMKNRELKRKFIHFPNYLEMVETLEIWGIFNPIPNPRDFWINLYDILSQEAHVYPDQTEVGRRLLLLEQGNPFEINIIPKELNEFSKILHEVMDLSIVVELNILSDWIEQDKNVKSKLKEKLEVLRNSELKFSLKKLSSLVK
ncbi:MAG: hypothetical protein NC903_03660, partial [Candidatus Omnitrophica bacterium]|nr:hypothetical protein [Candidatus Omnitrophota bacterium]